MARSGSEVRDIVVPGEPVECAGRKAGFGMYRKDGRFYSSTLGLKSMRGNYVDKFVKDSREYFSIKDEFQKLLEDNASKITDEEVKIFINTADKDGDKITSHYLTATWGLSMLLPICETILTNTSLTSPPSSLTMLSAILFARTL